MTIYSKIRWVASILLVFFIVLITNLVDRNHFNRLSYSVTTMYEDRLVASDLIFQMSRLIQEKELAAATMDTTFFNRRSDALNAEISGLAEVYKRTKLTEKEQLFFTRLLGEFDALKEKEQDSENMAFQNVQERIERINQHLNALSKIQLQEGRRQVLISDKAKAAINLFTQWEIIFLILMAVMVQVIILYKPSEAKEKKSESPITHGQ